MRPDRLLPICVVACVGLPDQAIAGWSCGIDESLLPQVYALEVIDDRLMAYVGPIERSEDGAGATVVAVDAQGNWTVQPRSEVPIRTASVYADACMDPPPDEEWLRANQPWWDPENHYFQQKIGVCATGGGKRWGGISFYGGEGYGGVGGIVEEDIETGSIRYYRPLKLLDRSTSHLAYFGDNLWIGTAWYGECGTGVGVGVLSAFFDNDEMYADWTLGASTCGFQVSDMVVHSDALWIATELGLSKVSLSGSRYHYKKFAWTNYVPTGDAENPMREVTCDEVYEELFESEELANAPANDDGAPYAVLWGRVSELRPNFAWQYVRKLNGLDPTDRARVAGLAFTKRGSGDCGVFFFDPATGQTRSLAHAPECPDRLFVSTAPETIYFVLEKELHFVHLSESVGEIHRLPLPDDNFETYRASLAVKPDDQYFPSRESNRLLPTLAGTLNDGRIAIVMGIDMPADDQYSYLFVRNDDHWDIEDQKWCHRFEFPCTFETLDSDVSYYWEMQNGRSVWSQSPEHNDFLKFVESRSPLNEFGHPMAERELRFEVDGISSSVVARGNYGQDTGLIGTYSMRIVVDGEELRSFSVATCGASSFGRYLLVHPCSSSGNGHLINLETGETRIDSLMQVVWVN